MQDVRRAFLLSLGAATGSSVGVAVGLAATAAVGMSLFPALPLGAAAGAALGLLAGRLAGGARAATNGKAHPTLALVVIARDEEHGLPMAIASARDYVDEIVIAVDSRTRDRTREVVPGARVFDVDFQDFAQMRAAAIRAAKSDWILMLDGDEVLEGDPRPLLGKRRIWKMPRHHWMDLERTLPAPEECTFPDRQPRLFPRDPRIRFVRPLHEIVVGLRVKRTTSPVIHHFKRALRPAAVLEERRRMYAELKERGIREGYRFGPRD